MSDNLTEIMRNSTFNIEEGRFVYAKVRTVPKMKDRPCMVFCDEDEITVVAKEKHLKDLDLIEKNKDYYRAFSLNVSIPFYSVGFLSTISGAIAERGINVLIVSTYSKDYILVRDDRAAIVKEALIDMGMNYRA